MDAPISGGLCLFGRVFSCIIAFQKWFAHGTNHVFYSPLLVAGLDLGVLEGAGPDEEGGEERGVVHVGHDGLPAVVPANT